MYESVCLRCLCVRACAYAKQLFSRLETFLSMYESAFEVYVCVRCLCEYACVRCLCIYVHV